MKLLTKLITQIIVFYNRSNYTKMKKIYKKIILIPASNRDKVA